VPSISSASKRIEGVTTGDFTTGICSAAVPAAVERAGRLAPDRTTHSRPHLAVAAPRLRAILHHAHGHFQCIPESVELLVVALAIIHFIRRRPDTYWIYIILFLGPLGAAIYLLSRLCPTWGSCASRSRFFPEEGASMNWRPPSSTTPPPAITKNSPISTWKMGTSRERALATTRQSRRARTRPILLSPGVCEVQLADFAAAVLIWSELSAGSGYDFHRARGLLAHAYAIPLSLRKLKAYSSRQP